MNKEKHILVVEDDKNIRDTLRDALELEGYSVSTASNGLEGLDQIKMMMPRPSLVLLDMMMPIMNGREFLDAVMADENLATIPVVIVSADIDDDKKVGAKAYLKKPADLDTLLEWVEKYTI